MSKHSKAKPTPKALIKAISQYFEDHGGFDIADTTVATHHDVVARAQAHIRWYRTHTEEMAASMERHLNRTMKDHGLEHVLYNEADNSTSDPG